MTYTVFFKNFLKQGKIISSDSRRFVNSAPLSVCIHSTGIGKRFKKYCKKTAEE